jgi:PEP-CTERM motif
MLRKIVPALVFLLVAGTASATVTTSTFTASGNNTGGSAINAEAVFTFNNLTDQLTVTLVNLLPNPTDVTQNITDFDFQLLPSAGTISCSTNCLTSSGTPNFAGVGGGRVLVASGGGFAVNPTNVAPGWAVSFGSGGFLLNGLGHASIIGPPGGSGYTNANGSIAGNHGHNPFINQTAQWIFTLSGLPSSSALTLTPTHIVFSFGTSGAEFFCITPSDCGGGGGGQSTPEPLSFALVGGGLIGMYFIRRRRPGSR